MVGSERALIFCLNTLRWLGLSFTKVLRSPEKGDLVATGSKLHLLANGIVVGVFLFAFFRINLNAYDYAASIYKTTVIVYLLYTKLMILAVVVFSLCGNAYNRKFVNIVNLFRRVTRELERDFGHFSPRKDKNGWKILAQFFVYMGMTTALNLWVDAHLILHLQVVFRIIHYFCFYYVTVFTAHFVVTMNYIRENFGRFNAAFTRIIPPHEDLPSVSAAVSKGSFPIRKKLGLWMAAFVDLREVEDLTNEVFGKQIFLTFLLAFSSIIVNVYYFIMLNLHETSYGWLNVTMAVGFFQSMVVALMSTKAAELATKEANRINEIIFTFPVHMNNWQIYDQIKYFGLFTRYHPIEFKAWIFYAINYDSLFKVVLTSSAIIAFILQYDFLKGSFDLKPKSQNFTTLS